MNEIYQQFITGMQNTSLLEYIAVISGIASVWLARNGNTWVYPVGLVNTTIYIYLSIKGHLYGEASVNLYYTIMSIYGWVLWSRKDNIKHEKVLQITFSSTKEWMQQLLFFAAFYLVIFFSLSWLKQEFAPEAIPWADAFASASAYTGMWLMAKKKLESWWWWLITDFASVPLYFAKGYVFTSVQFFILFLLAISGLIEWMKKAKA